MQIFQRFKGYNNIARMWDSSLTGLDCQRQVVNPSLSKACIISPSSFVQTGYFVLAKV